MNYEWPLLIFTFLAELSVGLFACMGCYRLFSLKTEEDVNERPYTIVFASSTILLGIGLLSSMLHLGSIQGAPGAICNFSTSGLSREIIFGVMTVILFIATSIVNWKRPGYIAHLLWAIASLVGLCFIVAAGCAYLIPTIPFWNTVVTPFGMLASTLLLGCAATYALAHAFNIQGEFVAPRFTASLPAAEALLLSCIIFCLLLSLTHAAQEGDAGISSINCLGTIQMPILILAFVCGVAGSALHATANRLSLIGEDGPCSLIKALSILGFIFLAISAFMIRMLFYSCAVNMQY